MFKSVVIYIFFTQNWDWSNEWNSIFLILLHWPFEILVKKSLWHATLSKNALKDLQQLQIHLKAYVIESVKLFKFVRWSTYPIYGVKWTFYRAWKCDDPCWTTYNCWALEQNSQSYPLLFSTNDLNTMYYCKHTYFNVPLGRENV